MVQKLTFTVLTAILACLVVIIAQNRSHVRDDDSVAKEPLPAEDAVEQPAAPPTEPVQPEPVALIPVKPKRIQRPFRERW